MQFFCLQFLRQENVFYVNCFNSSLIVILFFYLFYFTIWIFKNRYYVCYPQSINEEWENILMVFRSNPLKKDKVQRGRSSLVSEGLTQLTMEDQFSVFLLLPNHHKWQWNDVVKSVKLKQRLSSTFPCFPGSPRNRIIQACCFKDDFLEIGNQCVRNILGI